MEKYLTKCNFVSCREHALYSCFFVPLARMSPIDEDAVFKDNAEDVDRCHDVTWLLRIDV